MSAKPASTTLAVRAGLESDAQFGAVIPPLHLSTTFTFPGLGQPRRYDYTRTGNPTRDVLGAALAELEGGAGGVVTATGMAAITLLLQLAGPEQTVVIPHDCYGGTHRLCRAWTRQGRLKLELLDLTAPEAPAAISRLRPRLVLVETPSNPLLRITDIRAVAAAAHATGALVVVDNTFLSPARQRPISLGADLVVHSTTKYVNGHSDVVGGAVVARDAGLHAELAWWANCLGLTGSPFDSFLTLRGLRSLHARLRAHEENAAAVAGALRAHPAVARVHWPGLPEHPGHALARRQQLGFGAMLSFELAGGRVAAEAFVSGLRHFSLAESLGGVESLIAHPASMTHAAMDAEAQQRAGIGPGLLRLSVGIEAAEDLVADVNAALGRAATATDARRRA
jgi:cystathionine gamma-synthase